MQPNEWKGGIERYTRGERLMSRYAPRGDTAIRLTGPEPVETLRQNAAWVGLSGTPQARAYEARLAPVQALFEAAREEDAAALAAWADASKAALAACAGLEARLDALPTYASDARTEIEYATRQALAPLVALAPRMAARAARASEVQAAVDACQASPERAAWLAAYEPAVKVARQRDRAARAATIRAAFEAAAPALVNVACQPANVREGRHQDALARALGYADADLQWVGPLLAAWRTAINSAPAGSDAYAHSYNLCALESEQRDLDAGGQGESWDF